MLYQLPEIHTLIGGEEKQDLTAVEGTFGADQLHIQLLLFDQLHTLLIGLLLQLPIFFHGFFVLTAGLAQYPTQRRHHILHRNEVVSAGTDAVFRSPCRIYDHMVAGGIMLACRVEKVNFLPGAELNIHHLHLFLIFILYTHSILLSSSSMGITTLVPIANSR